MNLIDNMVIGAKVRMWKCKENIKNFFAEECGVSNVVATIILVLIVVLLIAAFWSSLQELMEQLWAKIAGKATGIDGPADLGG